MPAPGTPPVPEIEGQRRETEIAVAVFRTIFLLIVLFSPQFLHAHGRRGTLLVAAVIVAACYNLALFILHFRGLPFPRPIIVMGDVILITLWIYLSGAGGERFFVLYYAVVIVAGLWFRVGVAVATALFSSALYVYVMLFAPQPAGLERISIASVALQIVLLVVTASAVSTAAEFQQRERQELAASRALLRQHWQRIRIAQHVDEMLRPKRLPDTPGLDMAVLYRPAAHPVLGDYYMVIPLAPRRWGISIVDVCAKYEIASRYLPGFHWALRLAARRESASGGPASLLREVNHVVAAELDPDAFIAMSYTVLDLDQGHLVHASAGLEPAVLAPASGGQPITLFSGGIVLGVLPEPTYEEQTLPLHTGDMLVLFTDGITEVTDRQNRFLGREGLLEQIQAHAQAPTAELVAQRVFDYVTEYAAGGRRRDDLTLMIVRVTATDLGRAAQGETA